MLPLFYEYKPRNYHHVSYRERHDGKWHNCGYGFVIRKLPGSQKSFRCKCLVSKFIETNWPPYCRPGVLGLVVAGRDGDAGWAWREWNKPEGRGGEIERMIHLAGGCREISGVEGLGGSWETEREMVPVGKTEMSWGLNAESGGHGGQSSCVRERTSWEEFDRALCRLWQIRAWMVLDKQGNEKQGVINKWPDRMIFVGIQEIVEASCEVELVKWMWWTIFSGQAWAFSQNPSLLFIFLCSPFAFPVVWAINSAYLTCSLIPHHLVTWCVSVYVQAKRNVVYCIDVKVRKSHQGLLASLPQDSVKSWAKSKRIRKHVLSCGTVRSKGQWVTCGAFYSSGQIWYYLLLFFIAVECHSLQPGFSTGSCFPD